MGNDFNSLSCQAWANLGATYPIADDRSSGIWSDFGIGVIPRNTIIDMDGVVRYNAIGYNESAVTSILDELLSTNGTESRNDLPESHQLISVFPNPFNGSTTIEFELAEKASVSLSIYDSKGHRVRQLLVSDLSEGKHSLSWNSRDDSGAELPSGVYIATLSHLNTQTSRKVLLLK